MNSEWRTTALFAAGSLAGGLLVLAVYFLWLQPGPVQPPEPPGASRQEAAVSVAAGTAAGGPVLAASSSSCPAQPLAQAGGREDGVFVLDPALVHRTSSDAAPFLAVAREALEQGRPRDAEVALIAACQVAEQVSGAQSAPLADVKSELGQHYVALAAREESQEARDSLLRRASSLYSDAAAAYAAALGRNASKTRMAERRLASVRDPSTLEAARRAPTSVLGAASPSAMPGDVPAFGRDTGASRVLVNSDPELAQLELDLQRLRAQAASVSRDPAGLRQRDAQAAARAAACQDKACLQRWYAQRRSQLLREF